MKTTPTNENKPKVLVKKPSRRLVGGAAKSGGIKKPLGKQSLGLPGGKKPFDAKKGKPTGTKTKPGFKKAGFKNTSKNTGKNTGKDKGRPATGRLVAVEIVNAVLEQKITLEEARNEFLPTLSSVKEKKLAAMIANSVFRFYGPLQRMLNHCLSKPYDELEPNARNVLLVGATQLFYLSIPDHAAIDESVNLAPDSHRKLVNAILRRLQREADELRLQYETPKQFLPRWLFQQLQKDYGKEIAQKIALAHLDVPPMDLTVFEGEVDGETLPTGSIRISHGDPKEIPGFKEGNWQVQDAAAAIPVQLLGDLNGKVVFDLCAAPGGKTAQICKAGAQVYAVDHNEDRLKRLQRNMDRLSLEPEIVHTDILDCNPDFKANAILLDAPCSATGTLRRHPELSWRPQRQQALPELLALQEKFLDHSLALLKEGGTLIYAVCSLLKQEGEEQIERFLERHSNVVRDVIVDQDLNGINEFITEHGDVRTLPFYWKEQGGLDGFYIARLTKQSK